jgi:DNA polymerase III subunit gamma/tau
VSDEYAALTMVLLRFLAFPPAGAARPATTPRAQPLRAPAPPAMVLPVAPSPSMTRQAPVPAMVPSTEAPAEPGPSVSTPPIGAAAVTAQAPSAPAYTAPCVSASTALGERWQALVQRLDDDGAIGGLVRELAMQAGLDAIDDAADPPCWHLRVERESLRAPGLRDKLAAALAQLLGRALQLELAAGVPEDSPALRDKAARARAQQRAEAAIRDDPLVQELLGQFKTARIVPGSVRPIEPGTTAP